MKSDDHFSGTSNAALAPGGTTDTSFTGMKPDTVSTAYDFLMREYSTEGRWPSPDPAGLAAVNPANPQSWNRYAYVHNNPLNYIDPYGLCSASFDYTYDLYGYVINGVFYIVGGWIEISNLELFDCGPQQRRGPGAGPGGGQGPKPTPQPPKLIPQTPQPRPTLQQVRCSRAIKVAKALGASAAINFLGAVVTSELPPLGAIFGGIAFVEGLGAVGLGIYAGYVCTQQ